MNAYVYLPLIVFVYDYFSMYVLCVCIFLSVYVPFCEFVFVCVSVCGVCALAVTGACAERSSWLCCRCVSR